jgi:hypothetical protein
MILLLLSNVIEKSCDYMISNVYVLYDDFMRFCIVVFVHHIGYVARAPCEREKWWHHCNYMCIYYTIFPHGCIVFWFRFIWVAWQPHQKCGLSVRRSSPREVPNPSALPCDDRMNVLVLRDWSRGCAKGNMRRSRLNSGDGSVEGKTYTCINDSCTIQHLI